jgi:class 3 adenylate cyclase
VLIILLLIRNHVGKIADEIKILSKSAQNVARGEYGPPIRVNSKDEIGQLITSYNAMVKGLIERDFIRDSFGRYVDPEFAKFLLKHPDAGKLGGKRREVAILMSDIRGFTALSETLSPEIIINVLNQYFSHMITIIQKYNGIIVDFFGDSILVFFEPFSDPFGDTIRHCVDCAYGMQEQMQVFNQEMRSKGLPELHMGIGINSGQVIVGNIGSKTRAKYGIVGSAVNITSRIQAKAGEKEIIVSDAAYQLIKNEVSIKTTFNETLKGVDSPITLHIMDNPSG